MAESKKGQEKFEKELKEEVKKEVAKEKSALKKQTEEFKGFIKEYAIIGMAIAFIMGGASKDLVQSLVNNIIMPVINPLLKTTDGWETATFSIGPVSLNWGTFLSSLINFAILALVVFIIAKKILKEEKIKKK